ncbi:MULTISPECIES: copper amine oxidase N-terminal domain-containing protein [Paenibacillus]|uniref:copper amine oxidase N-terminal domain-containing protein n=1 Tax=Paenibacillus TaxID=44249 RepID=UPI0022B864A7|nr:copper amine oxidase N-terminal domain-containing protein [Paenibacillus caseinilyticus]MCZ8522046.1 copper amine oxidase N-terminal domain-containing protein [Paenibacillus caseinilyticus]
MKKSLALLTLSTALMSTGAAYASTTTSMPLPIAAVSAPESASAPVLIKIGEETLAETGYQVPGQAEPMIPLRSTAEKLGFTLVWKQETLSVELNKGNIFTTVKTGEDRYAINRMYTSLGAAPALVENKLYVPVSFVSKVLHTSASVQGNAVTITTEDAQKNERTTGVVTAVTYKDNYRSVQIQGTGTNGTVLNVGSDTVFQKKDGSALAFSDLHIGMTVEAEHAKFATLSLPPQTPAYKITVLDAEQGKDLLATAGEIQDVRSGDKKDSFSVVIKGTGLTELSQTEVVLSVTAETPVVNMKGEKVDAGKLVKGAKVVGFYGPVLTKSLPPIGSAWKIVVEAPQE